VAGYISPNWYPSKHVAHRQVPTWNYEVVHAHGRLTVRDDVRYVRGLVARLTRTHEARSGSVNLDSLTPIDKCARVGLRWCRGGHLRGHLGVHSMQRS